MKNIALLAGKIAAGGLLLMALMVWLLPVQLIGGTLEQYGAGIVAGSRLYRGQALMVNAGLVQWRWCPSQGLSSLCVRVSGNGRHLESVVKPRLYGADINSLRFSGYMLAGDLGIAALGREADVSGLIKQGAISWKNGCLWPRPGLMADVHLGGLSAVAPTESLSFQVEALKENELRVAGDQIQGQFHLDQAVLDGELILGTDIVPPSAKSLFKTSAAGYLIPFARRLPCTGGKS